MFDTRFHLLPTMVGSLPHLDAVEACRLVNRFLPDLPAWPQLPGRSPQEGMAMQSAGGFPGLLPDGGKLSAAGDNSAQVALEKLYAAYLENDISAFPVAEDSAAGLYAFLQNPPPSPRAAKGQISGPLTLGLSITLPDGKAVLYDDVLGDAAAKLLRLKAAWMERELRRVSKKSIIFLDEPAMSSYGSAFFSLSKEKVISLVEEVLGGIIGLKGIHCCGNTDWSVLLGTSLDIVGFDTYNYAGSLSLYPAEVRQLMQRGGAIAWGIVPNTPENLLAETCSSLKDRLEETMASFTRHGVSIRQLREQALLTPSCGLAGLSKDGAELALELLAELSATLRRSYG
jgi:methionine synthase II (cobalamin-independent)